MSNSTGIGKCGGNLKGKKKRLRAIEFDRWVGFNFTRRKSQNNWFLTDEKLIFKCKNFVLNQNSYMSLNTITSPHVSAHLIPTWKHRF